MSPFGKKLKERMLDTMPPGYAFQLALRNLFDVAKRENWPIESIAFNTGKATCVIESFEIAGVTITTRARAGLAQLLTGDREMRDARDGKVLP